MKNWKKALALVLALSLCVCLLAACGGTTSTNTTTNDADKAADTEAGGELIMATNAAFPPFEFTTSNGLVGEYDGIDVAIAQKIAEKAGKTLKVSDMEFDGIIAAVSTGKVDMGIAGMTITEERKNNVDFSDPYYVAEQVIVVPEDSDIASAEDLKNDKKVGVVIGYTADTIVTEDLALDEANIVRANRGIDVVQDVKNGRLDAVVIDSYTGIKLAESTGLKVVEDEEAFAAEEYAIAVKKGNSELLETINATLAEMKENGEIEELAAKYNDTAVEEEGAEADVEASAESETQTEDEASEGEVSEGEAPAAE